METFMEKNKSVIGLVGVFLTFFLIAGTVKTIRETRFVGSGLTPTNTISVSGKGEVERSPDTAKISFSVRNEKKVLKEAQDEVSAKIGAIKTALIAQGVEEKFIKTDSYSSYPQYNYNNRPCYGGVCPSSTPTLRGYEVAHSITVSVKDLEKVESVLGILATNGVTDMQGPNFGFEDDKMVAREARDLAIADAQTEAEKLAKALGVKLVRVVSFNENSGGYPMPLYARMEGAQAMNMDAKTPELPIGAQKVSAQVTVVYEIR